ncbi:mechanosensitive ion channel family protein [Candidatus Bathyarchaeota archaeon]|nr:mechanosensitive ion channel family protein [Candidatus Bathyarchaeota archaeon]MBS7630188.1 mechanosensitive ion channel family protein [Candidatus Bathyarchaeota archaeon]
MSPKALETSSILQAGIQIPYDLFLKLAILFTILIATWIVSKIFGSLISKALGKVNQKVARQARRIATSLIWLIGILTGLGQLGLEMTLVFTIIIISTVIFLLSIRDLLLNLGSYEVIDTYDLFKVGDWIQVGSFFGRVVNMNWMNTTIVTPENEIIYIPNSKIIEDIVVNKTASGEIRISVPITIDDALQISEVEKILLEAADEVKEELSPNSKPEVRTISVKNNAIELGLLLKINNPAKYSFIASEILKRAKIRIDEIKKK